MPKGASGAARNPQTDMLSIPHLIVIFVVALVVFGPQKLPELARGLGKLMAEFRKASFDFRSAFEEEMRDLERQAREVELRKQTLATQAAAAPASLPALAEPGAAEPSSVVAPEASPPETPETVARSSETAPAAEENAPAAEDPLHDHQQPV